MIDQAHYEVGYGIKVRLVEPSVESESVSRLIRVGSGRFMSVEGIALSRTVQALTEACQVQGHSLVMVAVDDELVGSIELKPTVRPEAQQIIQGLRELGWISSILSRAIRKRPRVPWPKNWG